MMMAMEVLQTPELHLVGGTTESIFGRVEEALLDDSEALAAIEYVAARKKMSRYRSVVDFLYCEVFVEHRRACLCYYEGDAPKLRDILSPVEVARRESILLDALALATRVLQGERRRSWGWFVTKLREDD